MAFWQYLYTGFNEFVSPVLFVLFLVNDTAIQQYSAQQ
ncbi:hypothetical protein MuYL_0716 [Mucilaginibacter xinganensis]|uniref:Uncharacterized protein n=1 Tax=Mucilaginibacter xinganensis TaxID=1234841 RepID=A0A223NSI7_9SPHI|nr:hypothetical protein MuYL_0716 [Mucilaginibacter xinganensis]